MNPIGPARNLARISRAPRLQLRDRLAGPAAAALIVAIAACSGVGPVDAVDAHLDASIHLPDAMGPRDKCKGAIAAEDFGACAGQAFCKLVPACGFGQIGDTDCDHLPIQIFSGVFALDFGAVATSSVAAGRSTYDPVAAAACIASLEGASCQALANGTLFDACSLFAGKLAAGHACAYPFECADGSSCTSTSGNYYDTTCGTDVCKARVAVNASCTSAPCQLGDLCVGGVCRHGDLGSPCGSDYECDLGMACGAGSTCVTAGGPGASCGGDHQCRGDLLCVGDSLSPPAGTCRDVSAKGATCDDRCNGPYLCAVPGANMLGACVDEPAEGDACVPGGACGNVLLICDNRGTPSDPSDDICRTPGDPGVTCASSSGCNFGLFCSNVISGAATGVCTTALPDYTACTQDTQCASGNCINQFCAPFPGCAV